MNTYFKQFQKDKQMAEARKQGKVAEWETMFKQAHEAVRDLCPRAAQVKGRFSDSLGAPYLQFLTIDATRKGDEPNGIAQNDAFLSFEVDFLEGKVQLHGFGHVWLSEADKQRFPYIAMRSMPEIAEEYGCKKFRKQGFKDGVDLAKRVGKYFEAVIDALQDYTGGYPYKSGKHEAA